MSVHEERAGAWEGAGAAELAADWGIPAVHLFRSVGSTNDVARALAAEGAPAGTLVLAEEQRAGRGRMGRTWSSQPGLGLWMSMVLRPRDLPEPGVLPLVVGLAVARGLQPFAGGELLRVKWPNDLFLGGRKMGGVLCEGAWDGASPSFVVAGIGVNVLHLPEDFPEEVREGATSLRIAAGAPPSPRRVAGAVVHELVEALSAPLSLSGGRAAELEARDLLRGREVVVLDPGTGVEREAGTALGVSSEGALLLRTPGGALRVIRSGTVRPLPAAERSSTP